jgi:hypothetical protein
VTPSSKLNISTSPSGRWTIEFFMGNFFIGGPKSVNQVVKGLADRGEFSPTDALINFAVPSITTIDRFQVSDINTDKIILHVL